jgi:hypothetical protein
LKRNGTRLREEARVKGKPANGVGTQLKERERDRSQLAQRYSQQRDDVHTSPATA